MRTCGLTKTRTAPRRALCCWPWAEVSKCTGDASARRKTLSERLASSHSCVSSLWFDPWFVPEVLKAGHWDLWTGIALGAAFKSICSDGYGRISYGSGIQSSWKIPDADFANGKFKIQRLSPRLYKILWLAYEQSLKKKILCRRDLPDVTWLCFRMIVRTRHRLSSFGASTSFEDT